MLTASSESPSADCPTISSPLRTVRSKSADRSLGLPIATSSREAPAGTSTWNTLRSPFRIVSRVSFALPSGPPAARTVTGPKSFRTVQLTGVGVPCSTDASVIRSGVTVTPCAAAVSRYGFLRKGDVRRDSTSISQTPGIGLAYDLELGRQALGSLKFV